MTTYTRGHPRRIAGIGLPVKTQAEEEQADAEQAKTEEEQAEMEQTKNGSSIPCPHGSWAALPRWIGLLAKNLEVQTKTEEEQAEEEQTEKGSSSWPTPRVYPGGADAAG